MGVQSIPVEAGGGGGGGGGGARTWVVGAENVVSPVWREVAKNTAWSAISYKTETSDVSSAELASTCIALSPKLHCSPFLLKSFAHRPFRGASLPLRSC